MVCYCCEGQPGGCVDLAPAATATDVFSPQPRRVAAMSVAKRVSEEMGVDLGQEVGGLLGHLNRWHAVKQTCRVL
jgi:HrpA-like RNA helicase